MSVVRRILVVMATLALTGAAAGCTSSDAPEPSADPPSESSTPLRDFATEDVSVVRGEFCARVAPEAVADALGAEPDGTDSWANGDRTRLGQGVRDVAHEYGCSWTAADGTVARAWVFAPPVTPARASALARQSRRAEGCRPVPGAPAYGDPSVAVRCGRETSFRGLFKDAWLSCSLRTSDVDQAGRWCVAVAQAAEG